MVFEGDLLEGYRIDVKNDKVVRIDLPNVAERKQGKWIDCGFVDKSFKEYKCSNCNDFVYEKPYQIKYHKYCLHCGAEMRGAENG